MARHRRIALSFLTVAVVASGLIAQQKAPIGYDDTPMQPGNKWHIHDPNRPQPRVVAPGAVPATPVPPGLVDELSSRELDVLHLLRSDLSGPDIARELFVSLNTMRTHTKNIYAKLGVNNRREAIRRATELGL